MKTYIVRIDDPRVRSVMVRNFEKAGEPRAITRYAIISHKNVVA